MYACGALHEYLRFDESAGQPIWTPQSGGPQDEGQETK